MKDFDFIEALQKLLPWAAGLQLAPKIVISIIILLFATLFLLLIWSSPPDKSTSSDKKTGEKIAVESSGTQDTEYTPPKDSPAWPNYQAQKHLREPRSLTLYDLFLTDFPGSQRIGQNWKVTNPKGSLNIQYFSVIDLERRSKLLTFYIPVWQSMHDLCAYIFDQINSRNLTMPEEINMSQKGIGDSNVSTSKEAVFSGRIFIYHETELSAEEIGDLTKLYKTKNLDVQFRSSSYLSFRKMQIEADLRKQ